MTYTIDTDYTILVNKDNPLPPGYAPKNMVEIHEPTGCKVDKNYINQLVDVAYAAFKEMQSVALQSGYEIFVDSSYRSYEYQVRVHDNCIKKRGLEYANKYSAAPGCSEHQTGLAIDIIFRRNDEMIEQRSEKDPELQWVIQHCWEYGFILRYPKGKENISGFNFEPWHIRYVGKEPALEMFNNGWTLEEYHQQHHR